MLWFKVEQFHHSCFLLSCLIYLIEPWSCLLVWSLQYWLLIDDFLIEKVCGLTWSSLTSSPLKKNYLLAKKPSSTWQTREKESSRNRTTSLPTPRRKSKTKPTTCSRDGSMSAWRYPSVKQWLLTSFQEQLNSWKSSRSCQYGCLLREISLRSKSKEILVDFWLTQR